MKYLDPKADLTFKKIFGEHKDLLISLINALLPLDDNELVEEVEYLSPEMVPDTYVGKNSIVDVRCKDAKGRQFLVEMQMLWTPAFQQRVLFNASKAYVRQLDKSRKFEMLHPVYSLNLVNETFLPEYKDEYIHHFKIVHELHSDNVIEGLHFTFVELPKFKPQTVTDKKMAVLWLKFLTEIGEDTVEAPQELLDNPDINKALKEVECLAYTKQELASYENFWDKLGAERILLVDSNRRSEEKGRAEGRAEGRDERSQEIARKMIAKGKDINEIMELTDLTKEQIESITSSRNQ